MITGRYHTCSGILHTDGINRMCQSQVIVPGHTWTQPTPHPHQSYFAPTHTSPTLLPTTPVLLCSLPHQSYFAPYHTSPTLLPTTPVLLCSHPYQSYFAPTHTSPTLLPTILPSHPQMNNFLCSGTAESVGIYLSGHLIRELDVAPIIVMETY